MPIKTRSSLSPQNAEKWRTELSTHATKNVLRIRMKAFFSYESHRKIHDTQYLHWLDILKQKQSSWEIRAMVDIAKNIPLQTVKITDVGTAFKDRVQFLYPFSDDMEGPTIRGPSQKSPTDSDSHTTAHIDTPNRATTSDSQSSESSKKSTVRKPSPAKPTPLQVSTSPDPPVQRALLPYARDRPA